MVSETGCHRDLEIECYVLEDGTRALTQASFLRAIGRSSRPFGAQSAVEPLPPFLQGQALKPFLPSDIAESSRRICAKAITVYSKLLRELHK